MSYLQFKFQCFPYFCSGVSNPWSYGLNEGTQPFTWSLKSLIQKELWELNLPFFNQKKTGLDCKLILKTFWNMAGSCVQTLRLRFLVKLAHFLVSNPHSPKLLKINTVYVNSTLSRGNTLQYRTDPVTKTWVTVSSQGREKPPFKQSPPNLQQNCPE